MGWDGHGHGDGLKWGTPLVHISHITGPNESTDNQQANRRNASNSSTISLFLLSLSYLLIAH